MAEYIEREAVLKLQYWEGCGHTRYGVVDVADIENIPAADVVEVVRCKDCVYKQDILAGTGHIRCGKSLLLHEPDWYCPNGERRDTECDLFLHVHSNAGERRGTDG